jgi:hypothetical protein
MPRQRKTNRGPSATVVSAEPFTPATLHALLCDKVVLTKKAKAAILPDSPAIAHLVYTLNILQWKVRAVSYEPPGSTAKIKVWSTWSAIGMVPNLQLGGHIEPAGLGRFAMQLCIHCPLSGLGAYRQGRKRAARRHALGLMLKPYDQERGPLLARSIREWKDYAPELGEIFCSELPNPRERAAWRFIALTAPMITGEEPSFEAVRTELTRERWKTRE